MCIGTSVTMKYGQYLQNKYRFFSSVNFENLSVSVYLCFFHRRHNLINKLTNNFRKEVLKFTFRFLIRLQLFKFKNSRGNTVPLIEVYRQIFLAGISSRFLTIIMQISWHGNAKRLINYEEIASRGRSITVSCTCANRCR